MTNDSKLTHVTYLLGYLQIHRPTANTNTMNFNEYRRKLKSLVINNILYATKHNKQNVSQNESVTSKHRYNMKGKEVMTTGSDSSATTTELETTRELVMSMMLNLLSRRVRAITSASHVIARSQKRHHESRCVIGI